ncbi:MAG TPA: class I SAM-dependent methyltransferase [Acidimicrobiia bacterium]|nr:class I SAM-dependent methyltransferase [Acidimicrobiia bacterium]
MMSKQAPSRLRLFSLFLAEQKDPAPFHRQLASEAVDELPADLSDQLVVDLGCGPGHYTRALRERGANVLPVDLSPDEFSLPCGPPGGEIVASGMALPFKTGSVDGLLCSNMIEHTPDPLSVFDEIERIVRPGGWVWLSWTNWYSPWGGHDVSPFHYLGPEVGLRAYRRVTGREPKNVPMQSLFPLHIGSTLRELRSRHELAIVDVAPRYYPSQRWILSVPGLREVATWNCRVMAKRVSW